MRNIESRVIDLVADQFEVPVADVTPDLDVLTAYSAEENDQIELVIAMEREFGTSLNTDFAYRCRTPRQFANLVTNALL